MKLSEFLNLSMCDMDAYVNAHNNRRYDHVQKKESVLYEGYDEECSNWGEKYTHHVSYNDGMIFMMRIHPESMQNLLIQLVS